MRSAAMKMREDGPGRSSAECVCYTNNLNIDSNQLSPLLNVIHPKYTNFSFSTQKNGIVDNIFILGRIIQYISAQ